MRLIPWLLIIGLAFVGCQKETESPTSGALRFVCAESVTPGSGRVHPPLHEGEHLFRQHHDA